MQNKTSPEIFKTIQVVILTVVFLLYMPQHWPTTVGKLADKYELRIRKIEYHQGEALIKEYEVSPEESAQLLEQVKDVKIYRPVYPHLYRDTEFERGNHIELYFTSDTGRVSGTFTLPEAGKLGSVRHIFYPHSEEHPEIYEYLMKMLDFKSSSSFAAGSIDGLVY